MAAKVSKPSEATVLKFNKHGGNWEEEWNKVDLAATGISLAPVCYVFLEDGAYYKGQCKLHPCHDDIRRKILEPFGAPDFLSSQLCTDLNGYYGSKTSLNPVNSMNPGKVKDLKTWFRCLTKMILEEEELKQPNRKEGDKDYVWYEMGFFTDWSSEDSCRILCIGTPPELRERLRASLAPQKGTPPEMELKDPLALLRPLLEEVVRLYDDHTWRITKRVRRLEKNRDNRPNFVFLHDLLRHASHIAEVEGVTIETLECIANRQKDLFNLLPAGALDETYKTQAMEYLAFQQQMIKSIRWRSLATKERLEGEITLAYNMLANSDNRVIKSITLLTMVFLPATFISALFSTTFFSFSENSWNFSQKFWIYWVVVVPLTLILLTGWWRWIGGSYKKVRSKWLQDEA